MTNIGTNAEMILEMSAICLDADSGFWQKPIIIVNSDLWDLGLENYLLHFLERQ